MVKKVQAQMSTEIALDLVKASESVKSMTNLVNSATSAWKAQESQLRSAGDYLGATKAKYEGLGNAIQAQQAKIDSLKQKQSELKGNTQETANQYLNYQKQIDQASARLSSMETQQTKAKQAMDYYKSGLDDLQKKYKQQNDLSKSYVDRLEAEGRSNDALKAKVTASKNAIDNLNKQYEAQVELLKQVARDGDGDAYIKQKQRINETATALAKAKQAQDKLNDEWRKANPTFFDRVKTKIQSVGRDIEDTADKSDRAKGIFKATFAANIISNAFSNALGTIKSKFSELISESTEYVKYQQTMTASWNTLTGSAEEGAKMVKMTNDMAQAAANSTEMVDGMNQKLYSVTENADKTAAMTKQILLLQDAFGQSDAAVENFTTQWSQMIANGKVQGQDMMSIINVFPKMKQEIVQTTGEMLGYANITMEQYNELQSKGKVTSEIAEKALANLAEKYKDSTENFAETLPGLERTINARMPAVISAFQEPFLKMKNPLLQSIGNWVADKDTEDRFKRLGETTSRGLSTIMDSFKKVFNVGDSTEQINKFMDKFEDWVTKASQKVADNAPKIVDFFSETKKSLGFILDIGKEFVGGAWELVKDTFVGVADSINKISGDGEKAQKPMESISGALGEVAKHKDAIKIAGKAFVGYFAAKKVTDGVLGVVGGIGKLKKGIGKLKKGIDKVKDSQIAMNAISKIGAFATNPFTLAIVGVTALVTGFVLLYKHNKKFKKFVDDLAKNAKKAFDNIVKWFKDIPKNLSKTWDNIKDGAKGGMKKLGSAITDKLSDIGKKWNKGWKKSKDYLSDRWDDINKDAEKKFGGNAKSLIFDNLVKIGEKFQETWDGIKDGFGKLWDGLKKLASDGINAVIKLPNDGIDGINSLIHDFGGPKEAIKKIPKVKFASGTGFFNGYRNAITRPTLATLNDGNDSPHTGNQEMVIMPNGKTILPQGRNAQMLLPAGAEVLTASETAWMMTAMQNRQAFAKGTGFFSGIGKWANKTWNTVTDFTGNVWQGLKDGVEKFTQMFEFIKGAVTDPVGTLAKKFNPNADKLDGMFSNLGNALYKKPVEQAKEWWKELWGMAQSATDEGTVAMGAIGDDYRFKQFAKDSGADPWGYFYRECVSFVASRLANLGVNPSKFSNLGNGNQWVNANVPHLSRPRPGTVAVYTGGPVSSNHVDFVTAVRGDTYDGEEYNYMNNGQYHRYANRPISAAATFLDFGVRDIGSSEETKALSDKNSPLQKKIKSQVGSMFDWIKKTIAPIANPTEYFEDDSKSGTGVERWRSSVVKALKANGVEPNDYRVSKILATIQRESNGNPNAQNNWDINAINGTPSIGLMQTIGPTFEAYKHAGHNNIRNGYDNLLAAINYIKHRYGTSDAAFNRVASYGYANGGLVSKHGIYQLAEGNMPEYVIPTDRAKRSRAWSLLAEVTSKFANEAPKTSDSTSDGAGILQKLETKLDTMITLLTQLVANGANPIEVRNIIDGQSVSNGLAPYMQAAISNHERRQALLGGEII
ncbi:tape measure domain-containing protein [Streptococcus henryi]|uniref:Tape measure domain-containing protein n=1 Tax=Streptococcus henryi TaxID=439219 RepID=A0A1G6AJM5_9STRE|nr:tape measure protein [Streptococcus henryi]QBX25315.1 tail length tape-measure protein [Streptococcus phage Javan252]SDB08595.1 tape measure domain-containing protein [Streptococcus henryi]